MKKVFKSVDKKRIRLMLIFGLLGVVLITAALLIGIEDNLPGILLWFVGMASVIFAFIHHWRKNKSFVILLVASFIGAIVSTVLHNVLEAVGAEIIGTGFFLIAVLICPPAFIVGFMGILITDSRK